MALDGGQDVATVKRILAKSPDLANAKSQWGALLGVETQSEETALNYALSQGSLEIIRLVLDAGPDIAARGDLGRQAIHVAAQGRYPELVSELVSRGADINSRDDNGDTPFLVFARNGITHPQLAERMMDGLINNGADQTATSGDGRNAYQLAVDHGNLDVARLLSGPGHDVDLEHAMRICRPDVVREILHKNPGAVAKVRNRDRVLSIAVYMLRRCCEKAGTLGRGGDPQRTKAIIDASIDILDVLLAERPSFRKDDVLDALSSALTMPDQTITRYLFKKGLVPTEPLSETQREVLYANARVSAAGKREGREILKQHGIMPPDYSGAALDSGIQRAIKLLESGTAPERAMALMIVMANGPRAKAAIPALEKLAKEEPAYRETIERVLEHVRDED